MKKSRKMLGLIAAGLIGAGSVFSGVAVTGVIQEAEVFAATDVAINATNFPDANFRKYVSENIDANGDSKLSESEIAICKEINCGEIAISSLKGIEYFTALTHLDCHSNGLNSLDVSRNTALTHLSCYSNNLGSLDVRKNTALTYLECGGNNLSSLDVSKNRLLTSLSCYSNNLRSLDVSKNMGLDWLWCNNNELSSLDISKNTKLTGVNVYYQERDVIASNGEILISALSPSIVSSKITNLQGATLFGNKLVKITRNTITYDYKTGYKNEKMNVTLNVTHKKNGWVNENGGWKYYKDGKAYTGWHKMGKAEGEKTEHWSYFGKDGKLYTGWRNMGKNEGEKTAHWSYFGDNGWLRTGWQQMGKGTKNPDGNAKKHWSYFGSNGWLRTGWQWMDKSQGEKTPHWSYFGGNGWLRTGMVTLGKADGEKVTHKSYFGGNGWLVTNKRFSVAGKTYTADGRGWIK